MHHPIVIRTLKSYRIISLSCVIDLAKGSLAITKAPDFLKDSPFVSVSGY